MAIGWPARARRLLLAVTLGAAAAQAQTIPGTAARVNGVEISNFRLERHFDDYVKNKGRNITKMINPKVYKKLKREALDQLIEKEVVWQEAQRRNIVVKPEEVTAALKELESKHKSRDDFLRRIELAGFDEKSYAEYIKREIAIQRCLETAFVPPAVTDAEIHDYYAANPDKFTRPERMRARHVLIKVEAGADAPKREAARGRIDQVLARARKGEDFAALARQYSEDSSAAEGGDLGFFARGQMVPEFDAAAFQLKPGEVSGVVTTIYGFHVIKAEERDAGGLVPEAEVRERVRTAMEQFKRDQAVKEGVQALRQSAKVEVLVRLED